MQDNGKNSSIQFQNVPLFPTHQLLKSKHNICVAFGKHTNFHEDCVGFSLEKLGIPWDKNTMTWHKNGIRIHLAI